MQVIGCGNRIINPQEPTTDATAGSWQRAPAKRGLCGGRWAFYTCTPQQGSCRAPHRKPSPLSFRRPITCCAAWLSRGLPVVNQPSLQSSMPPRSLETPLANLGRCRRCVDVKAILTKLFGQRCMSDTDDDVVVIMIQCSVFSLLSRCFTDTARAVCVRRHRVPELALSWW